MGHLRRRLAHCPPRLLSSLTVKVSPPGRGAGVCVSVCGGGGRVKGALRGGTQEAGMTLPHYPHSLVGLPIAVAGAKLPLPLLLLVPSSTPAWRPNPGLSEPSTVVFLGNSLPIGIFVALVG